MGIIKQAVDDFDAAVAAFKASGPTRAQKRRYIAAIANRAMELLSKLDAQDAQAAADFAASRPAQFANFVDALPEPTLTSAPATDPVP
jgi:hypothetical protein